MILNIPLEEAKKVEKGKSFYTIKQILRSKFKESMLKDKILIRKDSDITFEIISYNIFDNMHDALEYFDFNLFNVGNTKDKVFHYYRGINGKRSSKKWITVVFKLKEL